MEPEIRLLAVSFAAKARNLRRPFACRYGPDQPDAAGAAIQVPQQRPGGKVAIFRPPGQVVRGQVPPGALGPVQVQDRLDDAAQRPDPRPTAPPEHLSGQVRGQPGSTPATTGTPGHLSNTHSQASAWISFIRPARCNDNSNRILVHSRGSPDGRQPRRPGR
jgi:hypothetical protein